MYLQKASGLERWKSAMSLPLYLTPFFVHSAMQDAKTLNLRDTWQNQWFSTLSRRETLETPKEGFH